MCLNTGAPWSEDKLGRTDFPSFMRYKFKSGSECVPLQCQDAEFCCAFPTRNGSNSMLKGPDASTRMSGCDKICREGGRVIIAVRGVKAPSAWTNAECDVYNSFLHERAQNFWVFGSKWLTTAVKLSRYFQGQSKRTLQMKTQKELLAWYVLVYIIQLVKIFQSQFSCFFQDRLYYNDSKTGLTS